MFELFDSAILVLQDILNIFYQLTATLGFPSYGLAIILMTLVIKMIMYPLTVKQVKSMKGMQILQPKMKELQTKYKDKPEKLQQEMIKLYVEILKYNNLFPEEEGTEGNEEGSEE